MPITCFNYKYTTTICLAVALVFKFFRYKSSTAQ